MHRARTSWCDLLQRASFAEELEAVRAGEPGYTELMLLSFARIRERAVETFDESSKTFEAVPRCVRGAPPIRLELLGADGGRVGHARLLVAHE